RRTTLSPDGLEAPPRKEEPRGEKSSRETRQGGWDRSVRSSKEKNEELADEVLLSRQGQSMHFCMCCSPGEDNFELRLQLAELLGPVDPSLFFTPDGPNSSAEG